MNDPQDPIFEPGKTYQRLETWRCERGSLTVDHGPWVEVEPGAGKRAYIVDEVTQLEVDDRIFGLSVIERTPNGWRRVDPREVIQ